MTLSVALALSALGVSPAVAQDDAFAFKPLLMPFPAGEGTILSGYKDPQNAWHRGPGNDYSLDFCQGRCEAGKDGVHKVVAPTDLVPVPVLPALDTTGDAVLDYHFFEVAESSDRKLCMALGHFDLTAKPDAQGVYPRGTELGTLVPYFGRPHVHIGMWTVAKGKLCNVSIVTGKERTAVAFEGQYELDGRSFPDSETDAVQDGLVVVSRNVIGGTPSDPAPGSTAIGPSGKPVSRPGAFEARLPWSAGEAHSVTARYDIESPAGFGLTFTGEVGDAVHPIYKGNVEYAGCATGRSAPLGRIVVLRREIDGHTYDAVYGHLDASYPLPGGPVLTDQVIGRFGSSVTTGTDCTGSDGGTPRLYLGILRDADISPSGEISGGRPVYAEPMVGLGAYEGFRWWDGPATAIDLVSGLGEPRGHWTNKSTKDGAIVTFGKKVNLAARVRDRQPIREVRFTAFYPDWVRPKQLERYQSKGFSQKGVWRILAVCRPPGAEGEPNSTKGCKWDGSATDAIVTYRWDPTAAVKSKVTPWQPLPRVAITERSKACVPVSFSFDVFDAAGYRVHGPAGAKRVGKCRSATDEPGKVVDLQPLKPPTAPGKVRLVCTVGNRGFQPRPGPSTQLCFDRAKLRWEDRSDDESGFYVYARVWHARQEDPNDYLSKEIYEVVKPWYRLAKVPANTKSWTVTWNQFESAGFEVTGLESVDFRVSAFNPAGESRRVDDSPALMFLPSLPYVD